MDKEITVDKIVYQEVGRTVRVGYTDAQVPRIMIPKTYPPRPGNFIIRVEVPKDYDDRLLFFAVASKIAYDLMVVETAQNHLWNITEVDYGYEFVWHVCNPDGTPCQRCRDDEGAHTAKRH